MNAYTVFTVRYCICTYNTINGTQFHAKILCGFLVAIVIRSEMVYDSNDLMLLSEALPPMIRYYSFSGLAYQTYLETHLMVITVLQH